MERSRDQLLILVQNDLWATGGRNGTVHVNEQLIVKTRPMFLPLLGALADQLLGIPRLLVSATSSAVYALLAFVWLATARPRAALLHGGRSLGALLAYGVLQLAVSFVLSAVMYTALYAAFVPAAEAVHALHFGLCQRPPTAAPGSPTVAALPARVARLTFDRGATRSVLGSTDEETMSTAAALAAGTLVAPLALSYEYAVELCLELPESPPNVAAGTFLASLRVTSARNESLLAVDRPMVLRYRSERVRALWAYAFALPLLAGWVEEAQSACHQLTDGFVNRRRAPAARATLALVSASACQLQVYRGTLTFRARLTGLSYMMTTYAFSSAAAGIGSLMLLHWVGES